jgi:tripartite-type tricarboxylate transporter receptor subunit TctC
MMTFRAALVGASLALMAALPAAAQADTYPSRAVKVLVPFAPGGGADVIARIVGEQLRKDTGQPFVVENKPGAFGIVGLQELAHARPDGYTLLIGNISINTLTPLLYRDKMSIDYDKTIVPVMRIADLPSLLVVTGHDFPPRTFAEFVDYVKKHPGKVRYGSAGVGSFPHFDAAILAQRAGLDMVHIPNKDGAAGINRDLSTGDSQVGFVNAGTAGPAIRAGLIRPIAVAFGKRLAEYPDVPTLAELGYPHTGTIQWIGLFANAATPKPILEKLITTINKGLTIDGVRESFAKSIYLINPTTSLEDAQKWMADDRTHWQGIIKESKVYIKQ